jgi:hypothetical protein
MAMESPPVRPELVEGSRFWAEGVTASQEAIVPDLTNEEIKALGHAVGLEIQEPDLTEVTHSLNALLEALDGINPPGLDEVEPLPIILPPAPARGQ